MTFTDAFFAPHRVFKRKLSRKLFGVITIKPQKNPTKGWVLISYVTHPFAITKEELLKSPHTNPWECMEISNIFLERGFAIDVIDWTNTTFKPKKPYRIVIDVYQNLERLTPILPQNCIKIFYITGAHWRFHNKAETDRIVALKARRGITLAPRRQLVPAENILYTDYATSLGNNFAKETYAFAGKPIVQIPLFSTITFPSPKDKDFNNISKNFVWIGGGGAVHKGLDIVLECFAKMPDYHLTICGPVEGDRDFYDFYYKELYQKPNIKFVGRIDVCGRQFKEIVDNSVGLIYVSASEGQAGSVITGLHAGLIPIVSHQSGVDVGSFGIKLKTTSLKEIENAIKTITSLPEEKLRERAINAWQYANKHHTIKKFKEAYVTFVDGIIKEKNL